MKKTEKFIRKESSFIIVLYLSVFNNFFTIEVNKAT